MMEAIIIILFCALLFVAYWCYQTNKKVRTTNVRLYQLSEEIRRSKECLHFIGELLPGVSGIGWSGLTKSAQCRIELSDFLGQLDSVFVQYANGTLNTDELRKALQFEIQSNQGVIKKASDKDVQDMHELKEIYNLCIVIREKVQIICGSK